MRLRRLELVIIGLTVAFACFIGGYLVGRNTGAVSISPAIARQSEAFPEAGAATPAPPDTANAGGTEQGGEALQDGTEAQSESVAQAAESAAPARDGRININLASRNELMDLPGIGPTLSERIIDYRTANGPFSTLEDLRKVPGIGEKRFETIKDKIIVG